MNVGYDLVVDFARPNKSNTIEISEGDTNSRICKFTLLANKTPMSMSDVNVALVRAVKEDGSVIAIDGTIVVDEYGNKVNEVDVTIPASITDSAGNVTMTVTLLSSNNEQITSFEFYLKVRNALYNEDDLVSESDLQGFRDLLNRCLTAVQKMEAMTENTALPNPYPINIKIEDTTTQYTGSEEKTIEIKDVAYISGDYDPETSIDETAALAAAASAAAAAISEYNASLSETAAGNAKDDAVSAKNDAVSAKTAAQGYAGQASGYATQTRELIDKLALPTSAGTYNLTVTIVGGEPVYSWTGA